MFGSDYEIILEYYALFEFEVLFSELSNLFSELSVKISDFFIEIEKPAIYGSFGIYPNEYVRIISFDYATVHARMIFERTLTPLVIKYIVLFNYKIN